MIPAFCKIWHLGVAQVEHLFDGEVEITEKIDGSQFVFGRVDDDLKFRSKGAEIFYDAAPKMFNPVVQWAYEAGIHVANGETVYGETLAKPKHNTLKYDRIPKNHFMLFGYALRDGTFATYDQLVEKAEQMGCEVVPLLYRGERKPLTLDELKEFLNRTSVLGGQNIEGIVIKNWEKICEFKGLYLPLTAAKYVSEQFKEVHSKSWSSENTSRGKWDVLVSNYRTNARWEKAIQHLADAGLLEGSPRDIGRLIGEVKRDITEEEQDAIKTHLWNIFSNDILRSVTGGLPEWYKLKLATPKEETDVVEEVKAP